MRKRNEANENYVQRIDDKMKIVNHVFKLIFLFKKYTPLMKKEQEQIN